MLDPSLQRGRSNSVAERGLQPRIDFKLGPNCFMSSCTFHWVLNLLWKCWRHNPENINIFLGDNSRAQSTFAVLSKSRERHSSTLSRATFQAFGPSLLISILLKLTWDCCTWFGDIWILVELIQSPSPKLCFILLIIAIIAAIAIQVKFSIENCTLSLLIKAVFRVCT